MVRMYIDAYAAANDWVWVDGASGPGSATLDVSLDPMISIDPNWLASHPGVQLDIATVQAAPSGVPEPPTWAMLAAGLGFAGWRKRNGARSAST